MYFLHTEASFDMAHRLLGYEGKCSNLHGHTVKIEVTVSNRTLQPIGFVVDFQILDRLIKKWINDNWDHVTILSASDKLCEQLVDTKVYKMESNPTAENLAYELYNKLSALFEEQQEGYKIDSVTVWETPKHAATYIREEIG